MPRKHVPQRITKGLNQHIARLAQYSRTIPKPRKRKLKMNTEYKVVERTVFQVVETNNHGKSGSVRSVAICDHLPDAKALVASLTNTPRPDGERP